MARQPRSFRDAMGAVRLIVALLAMTLIACAPVAQSSDARSAAVEPSPAIAATPTTSDAASTPTPASPSPPATVAVAPVTSPTPTPTPAATETRSAAPSASAARAVPIGTVPPPTLAPTASVPAGPLSVRVRGNALVDGGGRRIRLIGVDRDGSEYMCLLRGSVFDGPVDDRAISAMAAWGINAVRIPLNEDCWLGINLIDQRFGGLTYQNAVRDYVARLHRAGLYTILDLHWSAPGANIAANQQAMADADHSAVFWSSVAAAFRDDPAMIFDLYNEPFVDAALGPRPRAEYWSCWLQGCTVPVRMSPPGDTRNTDNWQTTGMQQLVDAVRATGARQLIMVGGLQWSNDMRDLLTHLPSDPAGQLAVSWHVYNWNPCRTVTCWSDTVTPVAQQLPVIAGEFGENDCINDFVNGFMTWADQQGISYLGWAWNTYGGDCHSGFSLISSYDGTPSAYGRGFRDHFFALGVR